MKKIVIILICLLCYGCKEESRIPISNTLEIALGDNYSSYVTNLNLAYEKDRSAAIRILKIDYIYDAGGYDHGYILYQLIKRYSDNEFTAILKKLSRNDLITVNQYLEVGLDANDKKREEFKRDYPISLSVLNQ
ncbi:hypothetical protein [Flavobacterium gelatinilyticum]|uniref:hypothetical protein n=1 Tax=Flavobacterium gelatinilyticum TaxID=3003260 RepID=UPI0024817473|nr:hypothetical protein [Flavobacterium gelatinilyticum]